MMTGVAPTGGRLLSLCTLTDQPRLARHRLRTSHETRGCTAPLATHRLRRCRDDGRWQWCRRLCNV